MARLRLYPHRTADASSVEFGDWWIERSGSRMVLPEVLTGWDYASEERIGTTLTADVGELLGSTGHRSLDDLEVLLLADCASAQRRVVARHPLLGRTILDSVDFSLPLPRGELADSVRVSAHLVVARNIVGAPPGVAHMRGSRLIASKPRTVNLEGEAARFPTEPVPFSELGLPNAPWTLQTTFDDLQQAFMGGVRMLVNTEHPVGRMLLDSSTVSRVSGLAKADVFRLLIAKLSEPSFRDEVNNGGFEEGSIGHAVDGMCQLYLGQGLGATSRGYVDDPVHFDRILHDQLRPLEGVIA